MLYVIAYLINIPLFVLAVAAYVVEFIPCRMLRAEDDGPFTALFADAIIWVECKANLWTDRLNERMNRHDDYMGAN